MAQALKKTKIEKDRFTPDGVRLFNATKEHGVVYADGFTEVKYIQMYEERELHYRGDGTPVGYRAGEPLPKHQDELLDENEKLQARIRDLEDSQKKTNDLMTRLLAQLESKAESKADPAPTAAFLDTKSEAPARGVSKPK